MVDQNKISEWYNGLTFMDKLLMGIGGMITAGIGGALAITVISKTNKPASLESFKRGVVVGSLVWEPIDALLKKMFEGNPSAEKVRYWIDQIFDILKIIAASKQLSQVFGR
jgi:hypothetical protein